MPKHLWEFRVQDQVKAIAGFSAVAKKYGAQRKLLMACATNYVWRDPVTRREHGLYGGGAIGRVSVPTDRWDGAALDQSNTSTAVMVPFWMRAWLAVPPLLARDIWDVFDEHTRQIVKPNTWLYPCYCRLAMGLSHAVRILLSINTTSIGRTLLSQIGLETLEAT